MGGQFDFCIQGLVEVGDGTLLKLIARDRPLINKTFGQFTGLRFEASFFAWICWPSAPLGSLFSRNLK